MKSGRYALLSIVLLVMPSLAAAQDFGLMESAETINRGNFKVTAFPIFVLQDGAVDNEIGVGLIGGVGVTNSLDVEGKVAFYDNLSVVGGDVEYWLLKNNPLDLSVTWWISLRLLGFEWLGRETLTALISPSLAADRCRHGSRCLARSISALIRSRTRTKMRRTRGRG